MKEQPGEGAGDNPAEEGASGAFEVPDLVGERVLGVATDDGNHLGDEGPQDVKR